MNTKNLLFPHVLLIWIDDDDDGEYESYAQFIKYYKIQVNTNTDTVLNGLVFPVPNQTIQANVQVSNNSINKMDMTSKCNPFASRRIRGLLFVH